MLQLLYGWMQDNQTLLWGLGLLSLGTFLGTLIVVPLIVIHLPQGYFRAETRSNPLPNKGLRWLYLLLKNVVGLVFVLAGVAMLVLPGQGLLTIAIGTSLVSFPGKRRLVRWIIRKETVLNSINWLRHKAKRPPLQAPE